MIPQPAGAWYCLHAGCGLTFPHLGRAVVHSEHTGHPSYRMEGGSDRTWTVQPADHRDLPPCP